MFSDFLNIIKWKTCSSIGGQTAQSAARTAKEGAKTASTNSLMGISLQEAKQILNVEKLDKEVINKVLTAVTS